MIDNLVPSNVHGAGDMPGAVPSGKSRKLQAWILNSECWVPRIVPFTSLLKG